MKPSKRSSVPRGTCIDLKGHVILLRLFNVCTSVCYNIWSDEWSNRWFSVCSNISFHLSPSTFRIKKDMVTVRSYPTKPPVDRGCALWHWNFIESLTFTSHFRVCCGVELSTIYAHIFWMGKKKNYLKQRNKYVFAIHHLCGYQSRQPVVSLRMGMKNVRGHSSGVPVVDWWPDVFRQSVELDVYHLPTCKQIAREIPICTV